jgi:hypothetical protein
MVLSVWLCVSLIVPVDASLLWSKTYGGEKAYSLVATSDGGYALAGFTYGDDFWLVKTDAFGNMEWNMTYGGEGVEWAESVIQTSDGGYALADIFGLLKLMPSSLKNHILLHRRLHPQLHRALHLLLPSHLHRPPRPHLQQHLPPNPFQHQNRNRFPLRLSPLLPLLQQQF